jgi:hypothetical protein
MLARYAVAAALLGLPGLAQAQTTCDILAANLRQDVLIQGSTASQFAEHRRAICTSANSSWGSASGNTLDGSISIPSYVDATLGTSSNASNWGSNFSSFCSLDEGTVAASSQASNEVRKASIAAIQAIARCAGDLAQKSAIGIFGVLNVTDRRDGFTVELLHRSAGSGDWGIIGVRPTPTPASFDCDEGLHTASLTAPKAIDLGSFAFTCRKSPETAIQVAVTTTAGALPVFSIEGLDDKLRELEERVTAVEGRAVPAGAVAWFESGSCPGGWGAYERARGRTVVGAENTENKDTRDALITRWGVGNVGGEESHQLADTEMPAHQHDLPGLRLAFEEAAFADGFTPGGAFSDGGSPGRIWVGGPPIATKQTTDVRGQGQPHNNMPPFVALTPCVKR